MMAIYIQMIVITSSRYLFAIRRSLLATSMTRVALKQSNGSSALRNMSIQPIAMKLLYRTFVGWLKAKAHTSMGPSALKHNRF